MKCKVDFFLREIFRQRIGWLDYIGKDSEIL